MHGCNEKETKHCHFHVPQTARPNHQNNQVVARPPTDEVKPAQGLLPSTDTLFAEDGDREREYTHDENRLVPIELMIDFERSTGHKFPENFKTYVQDQKSETQPETNECDSRNE